MKKNIIIVAVMAVMVVWWFWSKRSYAPAANTDQPTQSISQNPVSQNGDMADRRTLIVYTDTGYAPETITVKIGDTAIYKNNSTKNMWPASALHPSHAVYPTSGGCIGSIFDACRGVPPGESWSFKFDLAGEWKYHDHLAPSKRGIVRVGK